MKKIYLKKSLWMASIFIKISPYLPNNWSYQINFFSFFSCLKVLTNAKIQTSLYYSFKTIDMCFFKEKSGFFFRISYLFIYKRYNLKIINLRFTANIIFDKYEKLLKFYKDKKSKFDKKWSYQLIFKWNGKRYYILVFSDY